MFWPPDSLSMTSSPFSSQLKRAQVQTSTCKAIERCARRSRELTSIIIRPSATCYIRWPNLVVGDPLDPPNRACPCITVAVSMGLGARQTPS